MDRIGTENDKDQISSVMQRQNTKQLPTPTNGWQTYSFSFSFSFPVPFSFSCALVLRSPLLSPSLLYRHAGGLARSAFKIMDFRKPHQNDKLHYICFAADHGRFRTVSKKTQVCTWTPESNVFRSGVGCFHSIVLRPKLRLQH